MKKALKYIIILAVSAVLTLLYGFTVGGEYPLWLAFAVFVISTLVLTFFERKPTDEKLLKRIAKLIATAVIMIVFSLSVYSDVNALSTTFIKSYEAEASYAYIRKGFVRIYYEAPDGSEQEISCDRYDLSEEEIDSLPYYGGKIIVAEYEGLFGETIYKYLGTAE